MNDPTLAFIRDAQWQFWGVIVGILGIIAAFLIYWVSRQHKQLSLYVRSQSSIVNVNHVSSRIAVLFDGNQVSSLTSIEVVLKNTGSAPILRTDFDVPLVFGFSENARILDAKATLDRGAVEAQIDHNDTAATLQPLLLNSGDKIVLMFLVENHKMGDVRTGGRIIGVRNLKYTDDIELPTFLRKPLALALLSEGVGAVFVLLFVLLVSNSPAGQPVDIWWGLFIPLALLLFALFFATLGVLAVVLSFAMEVWRAYKRKRT
jgi:hypothetical protein